MFKDYLFKHYNKMNHEYIYIVNCGTKVIGAYLDKKSAELFVCGLRQHNIFTESVKILKFVTNSCYLEDIYCIDKVLQKNQEIVKHVPSKAHPSLEQIDQNKLDITNNPAFLEMSKQKIELQHRINMLNMHKKKLMDTKRKFEHDIKLFNMFNEQKQKDSTFVVPELFQKKFDIMSELASTNSLDWENFMNTYTHNNNYTDYFGSNSYEDYFVTKDSSNPNDIDEDLDILTDIESDSATDTSGEN
jgi:hypothetical protein